MQKGGKVLKPVDKSKNPGLAKLPTKVRNKMGFMQDGGMVKKGAASRGKQVKGKPKGIPMARKPGDMRAIRKKRYM